MPVLDLSVKDGDHWWCLAVDFVEKQIWIIDSLVKEPFEAHADIVTELVSLSNTITGFMLKFWHLIWWCSINIQVQDLDVLAGSNRQWVLDQMCNCPHRVMEMPQQTDTYSCGVLMLSCIKHCAVTFYTPHVLEKSINIRTKIFLEDLHSKFNAMKVNLKGLINEDRRGAGKRNGSVTTTQ
ncbi:uncharacterized protein LOC110689545 isoform X1 [Chenopodium quinoa]|uniref:uncharacterized protein LOC110689545 isoform X1 n=1 Tax=Chenopodium quinoa TaxID=63459 RepID=UPI000B78875C|nr:uncharacterized protein LOC110689545 isoform X1 [Chenopodium quinoa]